MTTQREMLANRYYIQGVRMLACPMLKTGQTTQYSSELDDGSYQAGIAKAYQVLTAGQYSGTTNIDLAHLVDTGISFDSATKEIRCAGKCGVFKAAGGDTVVVTGSGSNNGVYTSASATADKIVTNEAVVNEAAGESITLAKREAKSNNCVMDLNTGLMWLRDPSNTPAKMGAASDGLMPWTGVVYDIFAYCAAANTAAVGGYSDWRVPNLIELINIWDFSLAAPEPDATAFPNWPSNSYVRVSTTAPVTTNAFSLYSGGVAVFYSVAKTTAHYVALVRGGV